MTALLAVFSSCTQEESQMDESHALSITTSIEKVTTKAEKEAWTIGDQIGLYICNGSIGTPYIAGATEYVNAPFTYTSNGWDSESIMLNSTVGTIYAYYPYAASINPSQMAVSLTGQTDYMYGKGDNTVSMIQKNANITMKHALTQVVFKIKKSTEYLGTGSLSSVMLKNMPSSSVLQSAGTLDITTGNITGTSANDIAYMGAYTLSTTVQSLTTMLIPVAQTTTAAMKVEFVIDGTTYQYVFPAGTQWEAGTRNVYTLTLGSNGLTIGGADGSGVVITPWEDDIKGEIPLTPIA